METARIIDLQTEVLAVKKEVGLLPMPIHVINAEAMALAQARVASDEAAVKKVHARLDDNKKRARQVWQDWNDLINELCEPFEKDKDIHVKKIRDYIAEEKRKALEEESRLREIARKQEEERILAEAAELEKEGRTAEADEIMAAPIQVVTPVVKADVPRYDARTYRDPIPKARVINKAKFVAWVAASPDRLDMVIENERALNAKAKSLGRILNIPGVEYYEV